MPNDNIVDRFNVGGEEFHIEPIMDSTPTQGSLHGVTSNGVFEDKSSVPIKDGTKNFTSGGAFDFFGGLTSALKWLKTMFMPMMVSRFRDAGYARIGSTGSYVFSSAPASGVCYHNGLYVASLGNTNVPTAGGGLWYAEEDSEGEHILSSDYGLRTWHQSNITEGYVQDAAPPMYHNGTWIASLQGSNDVKGIYWSTDGKTWTRSDFTAAYVSKFAAYGNVIAAACGSLSVGFIYSEDGGRTWHQSNITSYSGSVGPLFCRDGIWLANYGTTYYHSTNGKEWTVATTPPLGGLASFFERAKYAGDNSVTFVTSCGGSSDKIGVYISEDNGDTWTRISEKRQLKATIYTSPGDYSEYVLCYGFSNNGIVTVYRTFNGSSVINRASESHSTETVNGICFIPHTDAYVMFGSFGIGYQQNSGSSLGFPLTISNVAGSVDYGEIKYVDGVFVYAGHGGIKYSTDFGVTWISSLKGSDAYGYSNHLIIGKKSIVSCGGFSGQTPGETSHYGSVQYAQLKEVLDFFIGQES